jgi:hypothetical protein
MTQETTPSPQEQESIIPRVPIALPSWFEITDESTGETRYVRDYTGGKYNTPGFLAWGDGF